MRFLFVLVSGPERTPTSTILSLVEAAQQAGHKCTVFFTGDGVQRVSKESITAFTQRMADLAKRGVIFIHCRESAKQRGSDRVLIPPLVSESSLAMMVELVDECDRSLVLD